jgi:GDP-L-fucose synthase
VTEFDLTGARVWVTGHGGMVGGAVARRLQREACTVLTASRQAVDLRSQAAVDAWMGQNRPDVVVIAAARVGGIVANAARPADFLYDNLMIESNLVHAALGAGVRKLLFLGSSCIYPKLAPQPLTEDSLLTGPLEETNEWYAVAKIAGIKLCQAYRRQHGCDFISAMPTNLYGPGDNFDLTASHVMPALMRKIHEAKLTGQSAVEIWGSGKPLREFLYVEDLADALVFLLRHYSEESHINVGTGVDVSIVHLAEMLAEVIGWQGRFVFDSTKPDGTPRKLMDVSKLAKLGWSAPTRLAEGLARTYAWFTSQQQADIRQVGLER